MAIQFVSVLAIPGVCLLMSFLSYASQLLFLRLEPGPLKVRELASFNLLVVCIWICYARACMVDPGHVPSNWIPSIEADDTDSLSASTSRQRVCRKCNVLKPPRSHHCKICQRCIPKMDHHCPWTTNCVSHFTFPHFMRFLFYAVTAMGHLAYFLFVRLAVIWDNRKLPSYLGPSVGQLVLLFILCMVNFITLFAVGITFLRTVWGLGGNVTTIESWEIERHAQLLRRARALGGYLDGPDGQKVKIKHQEFPYDIGIWTNICQGMGSKNPLSWFWPFSATPRKSGFSFEENGFEDPGTVWPPPDPDRMPRLQRSTDLQNAFVYNKAHLSNYEEIKAFKQRQQDDIQRREPQNGVYRRKPFHVRYSTGSINVPAGADEPIDGAESGEEGWQDEGGNRLRDYGVDEDVEFYDDDDIPLAELINRKKVGAAQATSSRAGATTPNTNGSPTDTRAIVPPSVVRASM